VFRSAIKAALQSPFRKYLHGSVVEKGGQIISSGYNDRSISVLRTGGTKIINPFSTHSECSAIQKAGKRARGATLFNIRITSGKIANSKPCKRCQLVIQAWGIKKVHYSIGPGEYGTWIVS